jgi:hypothetical protein
MKQYWRLMPSVIILISSRLSWRQSKMMSDGEGFFGYGNGGLEIAKYSEHHKVDYLVWLSPMKDLAEKRRIKHLIWCNPENTSLQPLYTTN